MTGPVKPGTKTRKKKKVTRGKEDVDDGIKLRKQRRGVEVLGDGEEEEY